MKIIHTLIIILSIFAGFFAITEAIGRVSVYGEESKKARMEICLAEEVSYPECYRAIFNPSRFPTQ